MIDMSIVWIKKNFMDRNNRISLQLMPFCIIFVSIIVPSEPPSHMEALLLNSSAVYLKWKQPAMQAHNGEWISSFVYFHCVLHLIKMLRLLLCSVCVCKSNTENIIRLNASK